MSELAEKLVAQAGSRRGRTLPRLAARTRSGLRGIPGEDLRCDDQRSRQEQAERDVQPQGGSSRSRQDLCHDDAPSRSRTAQWPTRSSLVASCFCCFVLSRSAALPVTMANTNPREG